MNSGNMQPKMNHGLTVAIIGVGLIGGSLGMAWRAAGAAHRVIGIVRRPESAEEAVELGACDEATTNLAAGVKDADVVVVCTPVTTIAPLVQSLMQHVKPGCIITDAGSTKNELCQAIWQQIRPDVTFIGGHPMAGSDRDGVRHADPYLFQNAVYVLTPPPTTNAAVSHALATLSTLVGQTGAHTMIMDAAQHDLIVAAVSHAPHMVAATLVQAAANLNEDIPGTLTLAAGGFRDTTRIAGGSPELWRDIALTNREAIVRLLDEISTLQEQLRSYLVAGDGDGLMSFLTRARDVRLQVPNRSKGILASVHEIVVQVIDRPGEIAAIAALLGEAGLNLIDIEILRVREGEGGTIRLGFEREHTAVEALRLLMQHGYAVRRR